MSTISLLDDKVINKIAAGEVIADPASVVKELIENSLDASSERIEVELQASGMLLIRVIDDGIGMNAEDLRRSVIRHATSKIKALEDLFVIDTMGFRGEALAAIASVSKVRMESAKGMGHQLIVEGGKVIDLKRCSRAKGTLVEVKELFYNVPARSKFQKKLAALMSDITKTVSRLALSNPGVSFFLRSNGKEVLALHGGSLKKRIEELFGTDILDRLTPIDMKEGGFRLSGYIGIPSFTKETRAYQYLTVNGRSVVNPFIAEVVKEGYATMISEGGYPFFVLHLEIKKDEVDVNVHPQKATIRINKRLSIREFIKRAIFSAIQKRGREFDRELKFFEEEREVEKVEEDVLKYRQTHFFSKLEYKRSDEPLFILSHYLFIKTYDMFKDGEEEVLCVDLRASLNSILFENMKKKRGESQAIYPPIVADFSLDRISFIEDNGKRFSNVGFELRVIGKNTIAIDAIPTFVHSNEALAFLEMVLEERAEAVINRKKLSSFVKNRKRVFTYEEAYHIFSRVKECENRFFSPLGEPTMVYLTKEILEKLFKGGICQS